jgi:hypothetical protein
MEAQTEAMDNTEKSKDALKAGHPFRACCGDKINIELERQISVFGKERTRNTSAHPSLRATCSPLAGRREIRFYFS